jgi:hypothetical protein
MWQMLGGIVQGASQGEASAEATQLQADAALYGAEKSAETQEEMFRLGQEATAPWREQGGQAIDMIRGIYGVGGDFDPSSYQKSPSYDYDLEESERSLRRQMNASGLMGSGAEDLALMSNRGDFAARDFSSYVGGLQSMANLGQTPSAQTSSLAYGLGQGIGGAYGEAANTVGQAQAQNSVNQANIATNMINQGANYLGEKMGSRGNY